MPEVRIAKVVKVEKGSEHDHNKRKNMEIDIQPSLTISVSECGKYCGNCDYCNFLAGCREDSYWCDLFKVRDESGYWESVDLKVDRQPGLSKGECILRCDQCLGSNVAEGAD